MLRLRPAPYSSLRLVQYSQNISNEELKNQVCWRLFNISSIGWLNLKDPEIIEYCKKNTTDKDLLDEINAVESVNWFKEYLEFAQLEKHISNNLQNVEKDVEKYLEYINKLYENERISQEKYEQVIGYLQLETSIYKGKQLIGALISKKLQEKLGFKTTVPKISVTSDSKLISQDE